MIFNIIEPSDTFFRTVKPTGDPECLCSRCGKPITRKDVPLRVVMGPGGEYRYHGLCLPGMRAMWPDGTKVAEQLSRTWEAVPGKQAYCVAWRISCPWAHRFWSQYVCLLLDLTTPVGDAPRLYLKNATHEVQMWALDPKRHPVLQQVPENPGELLYLTPMNMGYQFIADNNAAARARVQEYVDRICEGALSPDTDFRFMWDELFSDGASLVVSG